LQAGSASQPTVFLFSDTQLKEESFLEDINNILNTGETITTAAWITYKDGEQLVLWHSSGIQVWHGKSQHLKCGMKNYNSLAAHDHLIIASLLLPPLRRVHWID
jgi:hypothetical protein